VSDASTGIALANVRFGRSGIPTNDRELRLFERTGATIDARLGRYAGGDTRWPGVMPSTHRRGDRLHVGIDLRALNAYYTCRARHAVSEPRQRTNMFNNLVGTLPSECSAGARTTSPAIELIEQSRRVAMSGAPSHLLSDIYALGRTIVRARLTSTRFRFLSRNRPAPLPVVAEPRSFASHRGRDPSIGLIPCLSALRRASGGPQNMIAHTSAMFVEWLRREAGRLRILRDHDQAINPGALPHHAHRPLIAAR
jgi:hypothetical protein